MIRFVVKIYRRAFMSSPSEPIFISHLFPQHTSRFHFHPFRSSHSSGPIYLPPLAWKFILWSQGISLSDSNIYLIKPKSTNTHAPRCRLVLLQFKEARVAAEKRGRRMPRTLGRVKLGLLLRLTIRRPPDIISEASYLWNLSLYHPFPLPKCHSIFTWQHYLYH